MIQNTAVRSLRRKRKPRNSRHTLQATAAAPEARRRRSPLVTRMPKRLRLNVLLELFSLAVSYSAVPEKKFDISRSSKQRSPDLGFAGVVRQQMPNLDFHYTQGLASLILVVNTKQEKVLQGENLQTEILVPLWVSGLRDHRRVVSTFAQGNNHQGAAHVVISSTQTSGSIYRECQMPDGQPIGHGLRLLGPGQPKRPLRYQTPPLSVDSNKASCPLTHPPHMRHIQLLLHHKGCSRFFVFRVAGFIFVCHYIPEIKIDSTSGSILELRRHANVASRLTILHQGR
mmetsp:Transcript_54526/g.125130  ORF Transcript_54526/g.125130 Transcript_54526/m.125130 type:complete len:285 (-) Transcript_54526:875-1729(-)